MYSSSSIHSIYKRGGMNLFLVLVPVQRLPAQATPPPLTVAAVVFLISSTFRKEGMVVIKVWEMKHGGGGDDGEGPWKK
ncbi:hypothetical protein A2U01_0016093, partial [Trifolium medium]|nr:hypothetical protein [Trifolium medium]